MAEEHIVQVPRCELFDDTQKVREVAVLGNVQQDRRIGLLQVEVHEDNPVVGTVRRCAQRQVQSQRGRAGAALSARGDEDLAATVNRVFRRCGNYIAQNGRPADSAFDQ